MNGRGRGVNRMLILRHFLGVVFFCGVFLLGKLMVAYDHKWSGVLTLHNPIGSARLGNFFLYGGKILQGAAAVLGFVEVVAVMFLISGWLIELLLGW